MGKKATRTVSTKVDIGKMFGSKKKKEKKKKQKQKKEDGGD